MVGLGSAPRALYDLGVGDGSLVLLQQTRESRGGLQRTNPQNGFKTFSIALQGTARRPSGFSKFFEQIMSS